VIILLFQQLSWLIKVALKLCILDQVLGTLCKNFFFYIFRKWRVTGECCREYWNKNIPTTKVSRCTVEINPSPLYYKMKNLGRTIPALLYKSAANVLGDEKMKKDANRYLKFIEKAHLINEAYIHFNNNEWIFDSEKIKPVIDYLSP